MARSSADRNSKRASIIPWHRWGASFTVLAIFLLVVFLTGGSSRYDVPHLLILRPLSICVLGYALATMTADEFRSRRALWLLIGAIVTLVVSHLIPLPPSVWQALPGRQIIVEIDKAAGLTGIWRPLTMSFEGTLNALYSLAVPLAVALLASRLDEDGLVRLLILLLALTALSALIGVLQAGGSGLKLYPISIGSGGLFANRNHQAAALACVVPMLMALAMCSSRISRQPRIMRSVLALAAASLVPLVLVTGSRMGLLVFALAVFVVSGSYFLTRRASATGVPRGLVALAFGAVVIVAMVSLTVFTARDVAIDRVSDGGEDLRLSFWETLVEFLPEYMPWGSGVGSFVPVYQIHEKSSDLMPQYVNQAHNDWLDLALTAGVPGMVLAVVAAVMYFVAARNALAAGGIAGHLRRAGLAVVILLAFASLSDYPVRTPILSSLLAVAAVWATTPVQPRTSVKRPVAP